MRTGEEELFKARSRDQGSVKIIDIVRARLDTRSDSYAAEVPSLAIKDAQIDDELVRANEHMLTDGFYAEVTLEYDPVIAQERNGRPFRIAGLRPIRDRPARHWLCGAPPGGSGLDRYRPACGAGSR